MSLPVPEDTMSRARRFRDTPLFVAAVMATAIFGLPRSSHALDNDYTWEAMICRSDAIVELELTVGERLWGVGKRVEALRVIKVLMNLSSPGDAPDLDDQDELKSRLETRINWLRNRARREPKLGTLFKDPPDVGTWRVVVFLYRAKGETTFSPSFGGANSSGVTWTNHKQHRRWKRLLQRYIKKRVRAHAKGLPMPTFCGHRTLEDSAFKRYTLPPPCEEPCDERSHSPDRNR